MGRQLGCRFRNLWICSFCLCLLLLNISYSAHAYKPYDLSPRHLAGLWKLTQSKPRPPPVVYYPMKEFTLYPKGKQQRQTETSNLLEEEEENLLEMLLMLKVDGSFQQYADDDSVKDEVKIPDKVTFLDDTENAVLERFFGKIKGRWDYVDGKLILAADRPENAAPKSQDTLLVGDVVATEEQSLVDNPILRESETNETVAKAAVDTHLSVPQGKVNVGKFFYPKNHPSFFDQPMFQPISKGSFTLKQVLGSLNTRNPQDTEHLIEKFRAKDFYGKRFLVTSHPIGEHKPKGNIRWSIKYNQYVEDPPSKKAKKQEEEANNRPVNIRVMEVKFFANNTFATVAGLGESILRGTFHIIGEKRDHLWMQVSRFGFGRAVSGSVYSEGNSLTSEDEKAYWGLISYEDEELAQAKEATEEDETSSPSTSLNSQVEESERRLFIKGTVIFGYGLEPQPVGKFIMSETAEFEDEEEEEDDDDDDDEDNNEDLPGAEDDGIDWEDSFQ